MKQTVTVAIACLVAGALAACGSSGGNGPATQAGPGEPTDVVTSPAVGYRVGASAIVTGAHGVRARTTVDAARSVVGSATATPAGKRLYAVHISVENAGKATMSVAWGTDALDDSHPHGGPTYPAADVTRIDAGPLLPSPLRLGPGASTSGWIAYLVPTSTHVISIDFGLGDDTIAPTAWAMTGQR